MIPHLLSPFERVRLFSYHRRHITGGGMIVKVPKNCREMKAVHVICFFLVVLSDKTKQSPEREQFFFPTNSYCTRLMQDIQYLYSRVTVLLFLFSERFPL